ESQLLQCAEPNMGLNTSNFRGRHPPILCPPSHYPRAEIWQCRSTCSSSNGWSEIDGSIVEEPSSTSHCTYSMPLHLCDPAVVCSANSNAPKLSDKPPVS